MRAPLNLASRPFRNERLPNTATLVAALLLLGASVWHVRALAALTPGRASAVHADVAQLEDELSRLRAEEAGLRTSAPAAEDVRRWHELADLVDRRAFWWSALLSRLEAALPWDVRLVSISPEVAGGGVEVSLQAEARTTDAALRLIGALEQRPEFSDVRPQSLNETEQGSQGRYVLQYHPDQAGDAARPGDPAAHSAPDGPAAPPSPEPGATGEDAGPVGEESE